MKGRAMWLVVLTLAVALGVGMGTAWAQNPVRIFVDGKEVISDVAPQIVSGRVLVPIRVVAENLGAKVEYSKTGNSVIISSDPLKQLQFMRLNGELTTWPYWYENGSLYMEWRDAVALLQTIYSHPWYTVSYFKTSKTVYVNSKPYEVPVQQKGEYEVISLTELKRQKALNFDWDPEKAALTIRPVQ